MVYRMTEWIECTLDKLGEIVGGATPSTKCEDYYGGSIPWITPKDLSSFKGRYITSGERNITEKGLASCSAQMMPKDAVLFTSRAPIGYVAIASQSVCTNQGFKSIVVNDKADPLFVYYLLKYNKDAIEAMGSGTTFKEVSGKTMRAVKVRIPLDVSYQKRIAAVLDSLDTKIENNERINDNLLEQASSIYQAWFEDFILSDGSCPPSWKQGTLAGIADITSGKRPPVKSAEKTDNAIIPIVGAASVMGYTTEANHTDKILVTGRVGTHGVVQRFNSPCWASDNTLVITSAFYEYTFQILQRIDYRTLNRGSTQPLITQGDMNKVPILIPDNETLLKFETLVGQLMKQYQVNLLENDKLAELRDALLPKLMSGEIDVSAVHF